MTEYEPVKERSDAYQSEAALEAEFIKLLVERGYTKGKDAGKLRIIVKK